MIDVHVIMLQIADNAYINKCLCISVTLPGRGCDACSVQSCTSTMNGRTSFSSSPIRVAFIPLLVTFLDDAGIHGKAVQTPNNQIEYAIT